MPGPPATPGPDVDLAKLVSEHASANHSPSGIVAIAKDGEVLRWRAWGEDGYSPELPFRVASCTKSFTALALLVLRRAGRIGLDDEVRRHLPELKLEAEAGWPALRLRHLISMSGGLATDNPWGDRQESVSREQLTAWASGGLRLMFPPGSAYEYSNLGYALLGEVITRVSGQDYREFVREQVIDPLGLTATRFSAGDLPAVAQGYHREPMLPGVPGGWRPQPPSGPGAFSPIGGLYSSVIDLAAWAGLYLRGRVPPGVGFTPADLIEAQEPLVNVAVGLAEAPLGGAVATGYGFGLKLERFSEHGKLVSHAGGYPGFTAYMCWHADSGHTVIASANGTHSAAPALARRVMFRLLARRSVEPRGKPAWAETSSAVRAVEELVRGVAAGEGADALLARHAGAFADNVELDFPLKRRLDYLRLGLVNLGALGPAKASAPPESERPCRARWKVAAENGDLELFIELAPVAPYRVQTFSVVMQNGEGKVKLF